MSILVALLERFTREDEPIDHDPSLDSWVELWCDEPRKEEVAELIVLAERVDSMQRCLECLTPNPGAAGDVVASLAARAAQSTAAIERCRRESFAPHLRALLRHKVARMEAELSVLRGDACCSLLVH